MMHFINSIPLGIRIIVVLLCGIAMIYGYTKGKFNKNQAGKNFILFLIICVPITLALMLFNQFPQKNIMLLGSIKLSTVFALFIPLGIVIIAFVNLKKGNFPEPQRTTIKNCLIGLLMVVAVCVVLCCLD